MAMNAIPHSPPDESNLISVICRTIGRPSLSVALESIAKQSYANIEVILVDALGNHIDDKQAQCGNIPVRVINTGHALPRSLAANIGMEHSNGQYLIFLDDDDWLGEQHIEALYSCLKANSHILVTYSSTQKTDTQGNPIAEFFNSPYNSSLLKADNYIPIHAALFDRSVLDKGCKFDEQLDIYEDWDFWLQLSEITDFIHIDKVSAFYRQGGDSGTEVNRKITANQKQHNNTLAREKIFEKWRFKWTGKDVNQLIHSVEKTELITSLQQRSKQADIEYSKLKQGHKILENNYRKLKATNDVLTREIDQCNSENAYLKQLNDDLNDAINLIYNSFSWRSTKPFRWIKSKLIKIITD